MSLTDRPILGLGVGTIVIGMAIHVGAFLSQVWGGSGWVRSGGAIHVAGLALAGVGLALLLFERFQDGKPVFDLIFPVHRPHRDPEAGERARPGVAAYGALVAVAVVSALFVFQFAGDRDPTTLGSAPGESAGPVVYWNATEQWDAFGPVLGATPPQIEAAVPQGLWDLGGTLTWGTTDRANIDIERRSEGAWSPVSTVNVASGDPLEVRLDGDRVRLTFRNDAVSPTAVSFTWAGTFS